VSDDRGVSLGCLGAIAAFAVIGLVGTCSGSPDDADEGAVRVATLLIASLVILYLARGARLLLSRFAPKKDLSRVAGPRGFDVIPSSKPSADDAERQGGSA
jgi:hypothetical protein